VILLTVLSFGMTHPIKYYIFLFC